MKNRAGLCGAGGLFTALCLLLQKFMQLTARLQAAHVRDHVVIIAAHIRQRDVEAQRSITVKIRVAFAVCLHARGRIALGRGLHEKAGGPAHVRRMGGDAAFR